MDVWQARWIARGAALSSTATEAEIKDLSDGSMAKASGRAQIEAWGPSPLSLRSHVPNRPEQLSEPRLCPIMALPANAYEGLKQKLLRCPEILPLQPQHCHLMQAICLDLSCTATYGEPTSASQGLLGLGDLSCRLAQQCLSVSQCHAILNREACIVPKRTCNGLSSGFELPKVDESQGQVDLSPTLAFNMAKGLESSPNLQKGLLCEAVMFAAP